MPITAEGLAVDAKGHGYVLLFGSVLQYLRDAFEAQPVHDLSLLCNRYQHGQPADLARVRKHEMIPSEHEAKVWLVREGLKALAPYLDMNGQTVSLKNGVAASDLAFKGRKLTPTQPDANALLKSPFDEKREDGIFADNTREMRETLRTQAQRRERAERLKELRESMQTFGWLEHHPAIVDENGTIIIGHRRLAMAKELGITPEIVRIDFGYGDAADMMRVRFALASNMGSEPLDKHDRQKIAMRLYGTGDWTMQKIADLFSVAKSVIQEDLSNCSVPNNQKHKKTASNPRGAGRPKGSGLKIKASPQTDKARDYIKERKEKTGDLPGASEVTRVTGVSRVPVEKALAEARMAEMIEGDELRSWLLQRLAEAPVPLERPEAQKLIIDFQRFLDTASF